MSQELGLNQADIEALPEGSTFYHDGNDGVVTTCRIGTGNSRLIVTMTFSDHPHLPSSLMIHDDFVETMNRISPGTFYANRNDF